ncbi:MAG: 4Fe-4S dicluster domain-containing protein [Clostridiales bacterium]|nr:4Fe-4S dicluster domain-containing protein [Clostridiales bacterium]
MTVADLDSRKGKVVRVRLGAGVYDTAAKVLPRAVNVYTGGGMMNARLAGDDAVIDEKTNFLATGRIAGFREALCAQCDFCTAYCPVSLNVRKIARCLDADTPDKAALLHPENCMECGLCSAVCPAGRDQAKRIKAAGTHIKKAQNLC